MDATANWHASNSWNRAGEDCWISGEITWSMSPFSSAWRRAGGLRHSLLGLGWPAPPPRWQPWGSPPLSIGTRCARIGRVDHYLFRSGGGRRRESIISWTVWRAVILFTQSCYCLLSEKRLGF